jgi:periplasmic divalent cation tolerance protein
MTDKILVLSTCPSEEEAYTMARALLDARLAACVKITPKARSLYHWQGKIEDSEEWMLSINTTRALFDKLSETLRQIHTYQVPEVIAVAIVAGTEDYLEWIERETTQPEQ